MVLRSVSLDGSSFIRRPLQLYMVLHLSLQFSSLSGWINGTHILIAGWIGTQHTQTYCKGGAHIGLFSRVLPMDL
jgi:hypothetical protein